MSARERLVRFIKGNEPTDGTSGFHDPDTGRALYGPSEVEGHVNSLIDAVTAETSGAVGEPQSPFFRPGHTYADPESPHGWKFRCDSVTRHPEDGERTAVGWVCLRGMWSPYAYGEHDWEQGKYDRLGGSEMEQFFQPGHAYTHRDGSDFRCVAVTTHPSTGELRALGWIVRNGWHKPCACDRDDWQQYDGCQPPPGPDTAYASTRGEPGEGQ